MSGLWSSKAPEYIDRRDPTPVRPADHDNTYERRNIAITELEHADFEGTQLRRKDYKRLKTTTDKIAEYAARLENDEDAPSIVVYIDTKDTPWIADGFLRLEAHKLAGRTEIQCELHKGSKEDAIRAAVGANKSHGLGRTRKCMQIEIRAALDDDELGTLSDRELGRRIGCRGETIKAERERTAEIRQPPRATSTVAGLLAKEAARLEKIEDQIDDLDPGAWERAVEEIAQTLKRIRAKLASPMKAVA